ncbi:anti-sigma factor domain-containing protein [Peribacillus sp. SCS-26]|uniref:anti-sigma factor domain-containing protein n=1 Tax=Paraperibacillus marinus TaxID=3115295 RepID=UPI003905CDF2
MSDKNCSRFIDYVNGHLSADEAREYEQHAAGCEACREELELWNSVSSEFPFLSEPVAPPEGMKERILGNVLSSSRDGREMFETKLVPKPSEPKEPVRPDPVKQNRRKRSWLVPVMAAALFLSAAGNIYLLNSKEDGGKPKPSAAIDTTESFIPLKPVESTAVGTASILNQNGESSVVVQAQQLQQPKKKEVYQVWLIKDDKPYRAGTFTTSGGQGTVVFRLSPDMKKEWDTIAITLEPDAKSKTPKGSMVLASEI